MRASAISLLLTFALSCLTGCGDKALDQQACDGLLAEAALNREHANGHPRILARIDSLEEEARALGCTNAPLLKTD